MATGISRKKFEEAVAQGIVRQNLLPEGARVGVAVSGGADSVALLRVLCAMRDAFRWQLLVLHVNHGLRGADSDDDESFVRALAADCELSCRVQHVDPRQVPAQGIEEWAREQRRDFFVRVRCQDGLARIATGHHRGDQAETVLFRLLRGAGSRGLGGIEPLTAQGLARPLLERNRQEIREYLEGLGQRWREDLSNLDPTFRRNRLRSEWLPELARQWNPELEAVLANTAAQLRDERRYLDRLAVAELNRCFVQGPYGWEGNVRSFGALDIALQRGVILHLVDRVAQSGAEEGELPPDAPSIGFAATENVRLLWTEPGRSGKFITRGLLFQRSGGSVRMAAAGNCFESLGEQSRLKENVWISEQSDGVYAPNGSRQGLQVLYSQGASTGDAGASAYARVASKDSEYTEGWSFIDPRQIRFPLLLRFWRQGDQFQLRGSRSKRKIKQLFQRKAIPVWRRAEELALESSGDVVWTSSFGVGEQFAEVTAQDHFLAVRRVPVVTGEVGDLQNRSEWESSSPYPAS